MKTTYTILISDSNQRQLASVTEVITLVGQRVLYTFVYTSIFYLAGSKYHPFVRSLSFSSCHPTVDNSTPPIIDNTYHLGFSFQEAGDGAPQAPPFRIVSLLLLPFRRVLICHQP